MKTFYLVNNFCYTERKCTAVKKQRTNHLKPLLKWVVVPYLLAALFIVRGYIQNDQKIQQVNQPETNAVEAMGNSEGFKDLLLEDGKYKLAINDVQRISDKKIRISFLVDNNSDKLIVLGWRGEFFIEDLEGKMHKYRVDQIKVPPHSQGLQHSYVLHYSRPISSISKLYTMQNGIYQDHLIYWEPEE